ncbi:hypothetical protein NXC14_CH00233 [Rhizobium sp. NXC14]|nr:hypothetical protein NXC14_CH00233 [Rhizobium sp. NXC14]
MLSDVNQIGHFEASRFLTMRPIAGIRQTSYFCCGVERVSILSCEFYEELICFLL